MARPKKVVEEVVTEEKTVEVTIPTTNKDWQEGIDAMNEYAARVWAGQSVDLPKSERIHRVTEALRGQGYSDIDLQDLRVGNA